MCRRDFHSLRLCLQMCICADESETTKQDVKSSLYVQILSERSLLLLGRHYHHKLSQVVAAYV